MLTAMAKPSKGIALTPLEENFCKLGIDVLAQLRKSVGHRHDAATNTVYALAHNPERPDKYFHLRVSMIKGESESKTLDIITNDESPAFLYRTVRNDFDGLWAGWTVDDVDNATQPDF